MTNGARSHSFMRWMVWWLLLAGAWLLLVAKVSPDNLVAAAVVAAIAASASAVIRRHDLAPLCWPAGWAGAAARVPVQVLRDTGQVFAALGHLHRPHDAVQGKIREVPFDGGGDDAASRARRALVVLLICLSPNTVVTKVDRERGVLWVHQLVPTPETPGRGDRTWPI